MRLTAELINSSLSYLSPLREREIDLRGHKIPAIENLGPAKDHESIDLTDNDIAALSNFPLCPRLKTLLVSRNRVSRIAPNLHTSIPHLYSLNLENNRVAELADLDPLAGFARLTHLVLDKNPVNSREHYRLWIIHRLPSVRFLDFAKVGLAERQKARELFGTAEAPTQLAQQIASVRSGSTFDLASHESTEMDVDGGTGMVGRLKLTKEERSKISEMIRNTKSLDEIARLEKMLSEGRVP